MSALPIRTEIRERIEEALRMIASRPDANCRAFALSRTWDEVTELTSWPTYCVIVTDEAITNESFEFRRCVVDGVIVIYVRDGSDPRAELDKSIEDVWNATTDAGTLGGVVREISIDNIECDDATRMAKPFAQAVLRWRCTITRRRKAA